ncbi:MAG: flagellar biosynthesis anti-sigma factor FlgM [Ketobacteraceae bacterium]|nr:flagellar biosynthesis anti-sigma factor FlgM [Ketobacteraceae bacterium]
MGLEINGLNTGQTNTKQTRGSQNVANRESDKNTRTDATSKGDNSTVSISDEAKLLNQIQGEVSKAAPFNETRVAELKAAIADGSYQPDANRIAGKLLDIDGKF